MIYQSLEDMRERMTLQMYDSLLFIAAVGDTSAARMIGDLHRWWASQGHNLAVELERIRTRLEQEREKAKAA